MLCCAVLFSEEYCLPRFEYGNQLVIVTLHIAVDVLIYLLVFVLVPDHLFATDNALAKEFGHKEDDLDAADDGEP